ncbi:MAG: hypothetical protein PHE09_17550 [Oscillospiraceae bacterium]|nr:hypothetical protein [Oscillospiraceae bacterium]
MSRDVDLLPYLENIVAETVQHYQSDFEFDKRKLLASVNEYDMENRSFYWMCRTNGTWLVPEREVFLKGSEAHSIWMHYADAADQVKAYRLTVTGQSDSGITGKVVPLNYREQVRRVISAAIPAASARLTFASRETMEFSYAELDASRQRIVERYGRPARIRYAPESEAELTKIIMLEHRFEKGWTRKKPQKEPVSPTR